jgi:hypothetical protein
VIVGLNVDPAGTLDPDWIVGTNAAWVRLVLRPEHELDSWLDAVRERGIRVLAVLARESGVEDPSAVAFWVRRHGGRVDAWQVGNEPDHAVGDSSWTMDPTSWIRLGRTVRQAVRERGLDVPIVGGGLCSGHASWLDAIPRSSLVATYDVLAVHPYGRRPSRTWPTPDWGSGYLGELLDDYAALDLPIWITELGMPTTDVTPEFQAEYCTAMLDACANHKAVAQVDWFCGHEYRGFGLRGPGGVEMPAYPAFRKAAARINGAAKPRPKPTPTPPPAPAPPPQIPSFDGVGPGIAAAMARHNDTPATREIFMPELTHGRPTRDGQHQYSLAYGTSGAQYVYLVATGQVHRHEPTR